MSAPERSGFGSEPVLPAGQRPDGGYVWFLESLDALHRAIQGTSDLGEALDAALGVVLDVLGADRAWLLEAHAETFTPVMERTRPEYPGGLALGIQLPFTADTARMHARVLQSEWCVQLEVEDLASVTLPGDLQPPRAVLAMAIYPKVGTPWILGMHQCSSARSWTAEEERLFVEIGHRLADALTSLIAHRDARESAQKLAQAGHVARLGYWERDVATFEVTYSEGTYEIFGLTPGLQTLPPGKLAERLHPDDRQAMLEAYERAIAGGPRYDVDYRVLHPGGEIRYVHSEADITWDADGRPLRMFGVMQDITERKRAEERLIRYRDSLERLAREQEALRRVATLVARATSPEAIFASVAEEVGRLLAVDLAVLARYDAGAETIVAGWTSSGKLDGIGTSTALGGSNVSTLVHDTRRPVRFEDYGQATGEIAALRWAWGVRAIVGVPVTVEGEVRGVIAVASTTDSPLPPDAEERLASFTELLATAYANAEAREALRRVADEQAALRRVATRVARGDTPDELFAAIAQEVAASVDSASAAVVRYLPEDVAEIVGSWAGEGGTSLVGERPDLSDHNVTALVYATQQPARIDRYREEAGPRTPGHRLGVRSGVGVPIQVGGRLWGMLGVGSGDGQSLPADMERRLASFGELAATAIANADAREERRRMADEQAALRRVATRVARGEPSPEVFAAIAEEVAGLFPPSPSVVMRYLPEGVAEVVGSWTTVPGFSMLGDRTSVSGHSVTALVFATGQPARIDRYQEEADAQALGRKNSAQSAVGVPIHVSGRLWGLLVVGSLDEHPLPANVEQRLASFGDLAATAIADAEARGALRRVADEQAALRRVATLVARGTRPDLVFGAVAEEVGTLLTAAELALVGRYTPDGFIEFVGAWSARSETWWFGRRVKLGGHNVSTVVFETRQAGRVDHLDDDATAVTAIARESGARSSAGAPIEVEGRLWGVMIVASVEEARLPEGIERELAAFTELIAAAIGNAEARAELTASRARLVTSADETRRRIVRDLHDGAQSRLVQTVLTLGLAQRAQDQGDGTQARQLLGEALDQAKGANRELRDLVRGILPSGLARWGLPIAVEELIDGLRIPVRAEVAPDRFRPEIEANAYFVIAEALTNVVKHADARQATVRVWVEDELLYVEVRDDGAGGALPEGGGLRGLADRIDALGGRLEIDSPRGGGTRITATLRP